MRRYAVAGQRPAQIGHVLLLLEQAARAQSLVESDDALVQAELVGVLGDPPLRARVACRVIRRAWSSEPSGRGSAAAAAAAASSSVALTSGTVGEQQIRLVVEVAGERRTAEPS